MTAHKQMIVPDGQKRRRERWKHKVVKLQEWCKAERTPNQILQHVILDEETNDVVRALIAGSAEIHEVIARAWQDIFRRWDKETT